VAASPLQDIKSGTGIEDKELRRTLQSLACGKVRLGGPQSISPSSKIDYYFILSIKD